MSIFIQHFQRSPLQLAASGLRHSDGFNVIRAFFTDLSGAYSNYLLKQKGLFDTVTWRRVSLGYK